MLIHSHAISCNSPGEILVLVLAHHAAAYIVYRFGYGRTCALRLGCALAGTVVIMRVSRDAVIADEPEYIFGAHNVSAGYSV